MSTTTTNGPLRLNVGGGACKMDGYVTVDRTVGTEAYPLDYPTESVDEVYASNVLEHFGWADYWDVLTDWVRVLKPGGVLRVSVPAFQKVVEYYKSAEVQKRIGRGEHPHMGLVLMGGQTDGNDYHKSLWDEADLVTVFQRLGLVNVRRFDAFANDCSQAPFCANIEGRKPTRTATNQAMRDRVAIVQTVPRLGWNSHTHRVAHMVYELGCRPYMNSGAYFDLGMERVIRQAMAAGHEYIVTTDYDSVWEPEDVRRLVMLMDIHPEADSICALQARRGQHELLVYAKQGIETVDDLAPEIVPVDQAHFGLTIFRASSLAKLETPWLRHDDSGEQIVEADVAFWRKWVAQGAKVYTAPTVCIGHMEEIIVWLSSDYQPIYQNDSEYNTVGRPDGAHWLPAAPAGGATPDALYPVPGFEWLVDHARNDYSQFGEDGVLEAIFDRIGTENKTLLEAGAHNGVTLSNSRRLTKEGWSAILVEPDDRQFECLERLYRDSPRVQCLNVGVGPHGLSVDEVLDDCDAPEEIDLVVIDIDGPDYQTVKDIDGYTPRVLVVEYDHQTDSPAPPDGAFTNAGVTAMREMLEAKGYVVVVRTLCNLIAVRADLADALRTQTSTSPDCARPAEPREAAGRVSLVPVRMLNEYDANRLGVIHVTPEQATKMCSRGIAAYADGGDPFRDLIGARNDNDDPQDGQASD